MIKEVIIRQTFAVIDVALAVAVAAVACLVIINLFQEPTPLAIANKAVPVEAVNVATVEPREAYNKITESGLFGDAGTENEKASEAAPPPSTEMPVVATSLPLKLLGTAAAFPTDPLGTAVIENSAPSVRKTQTYYLNQPVIDQVILAEINPRSVILLNKATNTREVLKLDADKNAPGPIGPPAAATPAAAPPPGDKQQISLTKQDLQEQFAGNYADVLAKVSPMPYMDASGKMVGITSSNLSSNPLAQKLGLVDNDVIQTVNGVQIDSMEKLGEIANRFKNANAFWVGVLRNGKPQMINFKLE